MIVSLIILLPVILLLLSALGITLLNQPRPRIGYSWIWASLVTIVSLGLVLFLRFRLPETVLVEQWRPFGPSSIPPAFALDYVSWPYMLSLSALLLATLFTDSARLQQDAAPLHWVLALGISGVGLLAVMADTPLTLVLIWTVLDLVELVSVFSTQAGRRASQMMILSFSIRVTGTLLVLLSLLLSSAWGIDFNLNPIPTQVALFMLLAVGLRLGVLPLNLPYAQELYPWRGLGNMLGMVGPASSLVVLGRMPVGAIPAGWAPLLLALSALAAVYGSAMWLATDPRQAGRPYLVIAVAALAIGTVIKGSPQASIVWGTGLVLAGSAISLYSAQSRSVLFILFLAILAFAGLPFTPAALGWVGLLSPRIDFYGVLFLLAILLLVWGYARRILAPHDALYVLERWIHTIYPAGLLALVIAPWLIEASNWRNAFIPGFWPAAVATFAITLFGGWGIYRWQAALAGEAEHARWVIVFGRRLGGALSAIFGLNWLYRLLRLLYQGVQSHVQLLGAIFEGDGGVLWALVILALLISIFFSGGSR